MRACLILLMALLAGGVSAQSLTKADRPHVAKGDAFVFEETDLRSGTKQRYTARVVDVTDTTIVTLTGAARRTYTREWNLLETARGGVVERTADPAWPYYSFPLEVGKRWRREFVSISREGNQTVRHDWEAVVEAVEQVTVPAGTFETFRIKAVSNHGGAREQKFVRGRMTRNSCADA
jgi:hypothetical protein